MQESCQYREHGEKATSSLLRNYPSRESFPSFEEGRPRRSNIVTLPQEIGAAGEVKTFLQQVSDLPRHADFKVALHLLDRRGAPSSKEGIGSSAV